MANLALISMQCATKQFRRITAENAEACLRWEGQWLAGAWRAALSELLTSRSSRSAISLGRAR
jgi:hypothetical protein